MPTVAKFERVSFEQFVEDAVKLGFIQDTYSDKQFFQDVKIPQRGTSYSAGYDISTPFSVDINSGETVVIPTGLRCKIDYNYFLMIVVRSSLGIKRGIRLANTLGICDADYANADNEGHIMIALHNFREGLCHISKGERIAQGIFLPYGLTQNDAPLKGDRTGGIGSTGK